MKATTEYLYFRVDFDGLTRQLRNFWAEGSYKKAIDYGLACGLNKEHVEEVIRGKMKMIQDPKGKDGVDGMLEDDNWVPNLSLCQHGKYPDPDDLYKMATESLENNDFIEKVQLSDLQDIGDEIRAAYERWDMEGARKLWGIVDNFPEDIRKQVDIPYARRIAFDQEEVEDVMSGNKARREIMERAGIPSIETYINKQIEREDRPTPEPTTNLDWDNGWLLPNGKFYPCEGGMMEHIWLADRLGKTENEAEKAGWIKLGKGLLGIHICSFKKPTKKQFNFLFDWSEFKPSRQKEYKNFIDFGSFSD